MNVNTGAKDSIDAALAQLPAWEPPADFAARTAALAVGQTAGRSTAARLAAVTPGIRYGWIASVLRALAMAACVSVAAWLGGELLFAVLQSVATPELPEAWIWALALGAVVLAWRQVRPRGAPPAESRITS
jgi:hypothetical protein